MATTPKTPPSNAENFSDQNVESQHPVRDAKIVVDSPAKKLGELENVQLVGYFTYDKDGKLTGAGTKYVSLDKPTGIAL